MRKTRDISEEFRLLRAQYGYDMHGRIRSFTARKFILTLLGVFLPVARRRLAVLKAVEKFPRRQYNEGGRGFERSYSAFWPDLRYVDRGPLRPTCEGYAKLSRANKKKWRERLGFKVCPEGLYCVKHRC